MRLLPLVPAAFAVLLYANTLGHGYVLDDPLVTTLHDHVQKGVAGIPAIVTTNFLNGVGGFNDGLYRPLVLVTFAVENQMFGNNPGFSHLVNVLLYAVTGTLLFLLLRSLFEDRDPWLSLLITLLFVSHPVHTEVVANLKGRDEILAFMNIVLSLLFLVKYARSGRMQGLVLGLGFFALAFLSKESTITMVFGIPLTLWFFTRIPRTRLITALVSLGALGGLLYGWREYVIGSMPVPIDEGIVEVLNNSVLAAEGPVERLSTGMVLQLLYIGKLIFPWSLAHDYSYNQIPPRGLMNPMTLLSIAAVIGLLALAFRGLKTRSPYSFGILFHFLSLIAVANLVVYIGATFAERFLFTPSLGFTVVLGFLLWTLVKRQGGRQQPLRNPVFLAVVGLILVGFSGRTLARNAEWKENFTLFEADVTRVPNSARAHYNYGSALRERAELATSDASRRHLGAQAVQELQAAIRIYPEYTDAFMNLGSTYQLTDDLDAAKDSFLQVIRIDPDYARGYRGLGAAHYQKGEFVDAVEALEEYIRRKPGSDRAEYLLGMSYGQLGQLDRAVVHLETAIRMNPSHFDALKGLGTAYGIQGDHRRSLEVSLRAERLSPNDAGLLRNIGVSHRNLGNEGEAERYLERARRLESGGR